MAPLVVVAVGALAYLVAAAAGSQNRHGRTVSVSSKTWVVDLGLLGPNPSTCQFDQGGPHPCPGLATSVAVQTCVGLLNRDTSVAGAAFSLITQRDAEWLADTDSFCIDGVNYTAGLCAGSAPRTRLTSRAALLQKCIHAKQQDGSRLVTGHIRFNASRGAQQLITPNIVTLAAVLDAIPLEDGDPLTAQLPKVFDAVEQFRGLSAMQATAYMHTHYVNQTSTMAQMNPGLDVHGPNKTDPLLSKDLDPGLIDYIVKERLFNFFMFNQCIFGTAEHQLMERIVTENPWPRPIAVFGYDDAWALAGDIFEAETNCVKEHNMGQIASDGVNNLAFYSRKPRVVAPLLQNRPRRPSFNVSKTYIAIVIGDGDSIKHMKGGSRDFILDRVHRCTTAPAAGYHDCFPLLWSLSPQLQHLSPDWLHWYYDQARLTTHDYFVLPPSGDLYSYPGQMQPDDQARFAANTEKDCFIMNTSASVEWEWYDTWEHAVRDYYPRYSARGIVRSLITVNVPYMMPVWLFKEGEFYHVLESHRGGSHPVVLFKPREWRGASSNTSKPNLFAPLFAKEINR